MMKCNVSRVVFALVMGMALLATAAKGRKLLQHTPNGCGQGPVDCWTDAFSVSDQVSEDRFIYCIKNNWATRDNMARGWGTFDSGRFSFPGNVGGRWYCTYKR